MQILYLGRAPRTKETLADFREKCWVARHSRVFRGLTGSQRTPVFWGVTFISHIQVKTYTFILKCLAHVALRVANCPGSFLLRNNLFRPGSNSIYFK